MLHTLDRSLSSQIRLGVLLLFLFSRLRTVPDDLLTTVRGSGVDDDWLNGVVWFFARSPVRLHRQDDHCCGQ
ncbi:MAG: hypothetical protein M1519_08150 [Actinobacteria bacterium]|nr:hypothetical protein [Actinomycetota bacterium]